MLSGILGVKLPGEGSVYVSQTLRFVAPVFLDETVTARATVSEIKGKFVTLDTVISKQSADGETINVVEGQAVTYVASLPKE